MFLLLLSAVVTAPAAAKQRAVGRTSDAYLVRLTLDIAPGAYRNGCGVAVAFESSRLELVRFRDVYADGLVATSEHADFDARNVDGDPLTDSVVRLAWASPGKPWATAAETRRLATVEFRVLPCTVCRGTPVVHVVPLAGETNSRFAEAKLSASGDESEAVLVPEPAGGQPKGRVVSASAATFCSLDVDGNGAADALTDGILVLRYLFGFSGPALTDGALGTGATRTSDAQVRTFLDQTDCLRMVDADASGGRDALTDGVLIVRYLFGFSGTSLAQNATAAGAARITGDFIASWLGYYQSQRATLLDASLSQGQSTADTWQDLRVSADTGAVTVKAIAGTTDDNRAIDLEVNGAAGTFVSVQLPPSGTVSASAGSGLAASATSTPPPCSTSPLTYTWMSDKKWFVDPGGFEANRAAESEQRVCRLPVSRSGSTLLYWEEREAFRLCAPCADGDTSCYSGRPPVLFVHGFQHGLGLGGGGGAGGTWGDFPQLVRELTGNYQAYEFRWVTAARFEDVAQDLGSAIELLARRSGRKVHVIAHSFGGILVRALLQRVGGYAGDAPSLVASVVTLGTPHSGIADSNQCLQGRVMPQGQDTDGIAADWFELCQQSSCHEAGEDILQGSVGSNERTSRAVILHLEQLPGETAAKLADVSTYPLPSVDILALLGMTTERYYNDKFDAGDALITYQGERFLPSSSVSGTCNAIAGNIQPLFAATSVGPARVTERLLGLAADRHPGDANDPSFKGYRHSCSRSTDAVPEALVTRAASSCPHELDLTIPDKDHHASYTNVRDWLAGHAADAVPTYGALSLRLKVLDAATRVAVPSARVTVAAQGGAVIGSGFTGSLGDFSADVPFFPSTRYTISITKAGYRYYTTLLDTRASVAQTPGDLGNRYLEQEVVGYGDLAGTIVNAQSGSPIAGVAYVLTRVDHVTPDRSGSTDAAGRYAQTTLLRGTYRLDLSRDGFSGKSVELQVQPNTTNNGDASLSPQLRGGEMRIVLEWGLDPSDLDSHLYKYDAAGNQLYHIYYNNKTAPNGDNLDLDDVTSFGPETTTIQSVDTSARYVFMVHHYGGAGSITTTSNARVTVTTSTGQTTFYAPTSGSGLDWKVFEINGGIITPCTSGCIN